MPASALSKKRYGSNTRQAKKEYEQALKREKKKGRQ